MDEKQAGQIIDTYPLSPMQQGMLFHYVSARTSGVNIEQIIFSLPEDLNIPAFRSAWEQIVSRHAVLRTSFRWERLAEPLQDVHQEVSLPYVEKDWTSLSRTDQSRELDRYLKMDRQTGFDLSRAPNMRLMVARLSEGMYKCVWTFHHILLDGRSFSIILNEVITGYRALCRGVKVELSQLRPFKEYIDWIQRQDWSKSETFWRNKLKGFTVPNNLQSFRLKKESTGPAPAYGEQELKVPENLTATLKAFAAETGVTLNTLVLGVWSLLLHRYTGEDDIVFGTTRACRRSTISGADSITGIFINTVPFRVSIPPDQPLAAWLRDIRDQVSAVRQHENTPLIKIQKWSEIQGRKALFDSLVMFDHAQLDTLMRVSCGVGPFRDFELKENVGFPLLLQAYGENRLLLKIQYSEAIYDDATVTRMLGHLQTLLEGMLTGADMPICDLPLLTAPERQQLLFDWNDAPKEYPGGPTIQQIFEQQVTRTPDAVALTCSGQSLTYRQLNARSNRMARKLQTFGVGPDVLVGICMERSNDLVIGLLAILKAGGAYLPIDLAYPAERLAFMLSDAQAPVLLTQTKLTNDLPETSANVLCVDDLLQQPETPDDNENPPANAGPDHLAYVIYTSGTTGKPKGSCITHRNVTRLFSATDPWYAFNEKDVWTLFHSYAFDFSVWEIWGALLYGGRLVVVPFMVSRSPEAFYELLANEHVTVLNQTPSAFRQLIQAEETVGKRDLALRYVIFGGEALEMQSLQPWFDRHGDQHPQLVNMYGITETTVHVTYRPLSKDDLKSGSVIGVPIPDLQVYILDSRQQPVPVAVPGEMYVGGAGLARGYLRRPELTAERFITDHLNGRPGSRLYKTGDLARFLPDRDIEYLGRIDQQVKIRGFRVELGEIESVLCQHPAIREAVVLAHDDSQGNKRLVAYLVGAATIPSVKELREHLRKKLPDYMVPAAFVPLEKIPLTNNGKVDHKALPEPSQDRPDMGRERVAPRTETEKELCRIWTEVLGIDRISIHDDFFDLGGHSLLVLRAMSLINERFKSDLPPVALFEHPTVASLCTILEIGNQEYATLEASGIEGAISGETVIKPKVDLALVTAAARGIRSTQEKRLRPYRMRESWICRWILAPLYGLFPKRSIRSLLQDLILKLEGGEPFTVTLRKLYAKHHDIHIGDYSVMFDFSRIKEKTRIGRYTAIHPTVIIQNAEHPKNTISTNALFYHPAFGFTEGYELDRVQVEIGNDVYIGQNAMILYPTKRIGDGALIAAGSAVIEDVPPYAIVGGYPAKVLRYRFSKEKIEALLKSRWWEASLEQLEPVKDQFMQPLEGEKIR